MSTLAATLQVFFTDRLIRQRQASPHTVAAYRDTFKVLLGFAFARTLVFGFVFGFAIASSPALAFAGVTSTRWRT